MAGLALVVAVVGGIALTLLGGAVRTSTVVERKLDSLPFRADVEVEQFGGPAGVEAFEGLPAVAHAEMGTFFFGGITQPGEFAPAEGIVFVSTSIDPFTTEGLLDGRAPSGEDPGEFVATASYAEALGAEVGDRLELLTISQEQADRLGFDAPPDDLGGPVVAATLVGIIDEGVEALNDDIPLGVFDLALLEEGDIGLSGGAGLVELAPGSTIEELREQLDETELGEFYGLTPAEPIDDEVRTAVSAQAQGIAVLAAIVGATAIVVLGQLLSRQLRLASEERTILRAVGFTRGQLALDPLLRAAIAVGLGVVVAGVLAYVLSGVFPVGFSRAVEPTPGLRFDPLPHLFGAAAFALLVLAVVAVLLALQGDRVAPARPSTIEQLVSALPWSRVATAVRFAFGRGPRTGSTAGSLGGLVLITTLVVASLTFGANLSRLLDEPARYGDIFDLGFGQGGDSIPPEVLETLDGSPDVAALTRYGATTVAVGNDTFSLVAFEPVRGGVVPDVIDGRLPQSADEMALGRAVANDLGLDVGDELEVVGASGPLTFRIVGIAVVGGIEEADTPGENGLITEAALLRVDPDDAMSAIGIDLSQDAPAAARERLSEELGVALGPPERPSDVVNLSRVRSVPFVVAALVGVLATLTLGHLLLVAVRRRARDFAVLRSCGATSGWVRGVVHWQASLTTLFAVVVAIPLGVAAGGLLYGPYAEGVGARPDTFVPFGRLAVGLLVLIVVANLVAAVPARRIRHQSPAILLIRS